jgi:hypothetical protein
MMDIPNGAMFISKTKSIQINVYEKQILQVNHPIGGDRAARDNVRRLQ